MKKFISLFILLIVMLSLNNISNVLYAQTENQEEKNTNEEKDKEEILKLITSYLENIEKKLNGIDNKIEYAKKQEEFEYYPAIRLNIDSPFFGMNSIVENRLRIKRDISTSDVANRYSIRDIVKNKIIRLPDSILGSIVMSTREYNIDTKMELSQMKLTLIKCIQYMSQVTSTEDYIDTQINNIFKDYISTTKREGILEIRSRNNKISDILENLSDKIIVLSFLGQDTTEYTKTYNTISELVYTIGNKAKNTLMLEDELNSLTKDSLSCESQVIDLQNDISNIYDKSIENMDYEVYLNNVYSNIKNRTEKIDKFIKNSTDEIVEKVDGKEEKSIKTKYSVVSPATLDYMKLTLDDLDKMIDSYKSEKEEDNKESDKIEEDLDKETIIQQNKEKIENLYSKYKEVLSREHKFYTDNINRLLRDSNDKISSIIAEIDSGIEVDNNIFSYTEYIYINLPQNLNEYINKNNLDSMLEKGKLIESLSSELSKLSTINYNITEMYDKMIIDILYS